MGVTTLQVEVTAGENFSGLNYCPCEIFSGKVGDISGIPIGPVVVVSQVTEGVGGDPLSNIPLVFPHPGCEIPACHPYTLGYRV